MRQVRANFSLRRRSLHRVAIHARFGEKYLLAFRNGGVIGSGRSLIGKPLIEFVRRDGADTEKHIGMLRTAVFRALAHIISRDLRFKPEFIDPARNEIGFARETRNPIAVANVG